MCLCVIFLSALTSLAAGAELGAMRTLTVAECLRRVAEQSPELKSGMYKTEALERRAKQAARPVNPRLETEIENAAGSGANEGLTAAETTVSFSQEIELGRKRRYRTALADLETAASRVEQRVRLSALLYDARCAVLTVLAAQEKPDWPWRRWRWPAKRSPSPRSSNRRAKRRRWRRSARVPRPLKRR